MRRLLGTVGSGGCAEEMGNVKERKGAFVEDTKSLNAVEQSGACNDRMVQGMEAESEMERRSLDVMCIGQY